jgi:c-di-GMP-binding flagellar brake protein YcgR
MSEGRDRRRAERLRFALRVRVNVTREGILVDLSEGGALLLLSRPQNPDAQITLTIEDREPVHLAARVVRCTPAAVETESATLARKEYHVAVQFLNVGRDAAEAVRRIVENNPAA